MTKHELNTLYIIENKSISDIIKISGMSRHNINKLFIKYGIQKKSRSETSKASSYKNKKYWSNISKDEFESINNKRKQTNLEKYGVDNPFKSEEIKDKIKQANLEKYGVSNPMYSEEIKDKIKQTNLDRYGVEYYSSTKECREKVKDTNIGRYGVECVLQSSEIKDKIKESMMKKYGVENPGNMSDHYNKCVSTMIKHFGTVENAYTNRTKKTREVMLEKYGVENLFQLEEYLTIANNAMLEKYGVKHGFSSKDIQLKCFESKQTSSWYKNYTMPSGKIVRIMGYEHLCLDNLLLTYDENEIITYYKNIPIIQYTTDGKQHNYYPDIYIPTENKLIEVKSEYILNLNYEIDMIKHKKAISDGYVHIIQVFNSNGEFYEIS